MRPRKFKFIFYFLCGCFLGGSSQGVFAQDCESSEVKKGHMNGQVGADLKPLLRKRQPLPDHIDNRFLDIEKLLFLPAFEENLSADKLRSWAKEAPQRVLNMLDLVMKTVFNDDVFKKVYDGTGHDARISIYTEAVRQRESEIRGTILKNQEIEANGQTRLMNSVERYLAFMRAGRVAAFSVNGKKNVP